MPEPPLRYEPQLAAINIGFNPEVGFETDKNPRIRILALDGQPVGKEFPVTDQPKQSYLADDLPLKGADYKVQVVRDGADGSVEVIKEAQFKTLDALELYGRIRDAAPAVADYEAILLEAGIDPDDERKRVLDLWNISQERLAKRLEEAAALARAAIRIKK